MSAPLEVLAVNESKLDNTITDGEIHIPGYVITRKDRNRHGGGVALYIKENISFSVRLTLSIILKESSRNFYKILKEFLKNPKGIPIKS